MAGSRCRCLGEVRRWELGGLTPREAAEMAEEVLQPYAMARARRKERAFGELLDWINGHPLSLRVLLPQLESVPPDRLLEALKGNTAHLPPGFAGEGRTQSLGASLKYSFDQLDADVQERLPALALFEGVADQDVLGWFSAADGVPARFARVTQEQWTAMLVRLVEIGLLTALGRGMYALHPALPAYLTAQWRQQAGAEFTDEYAAANEALLHAYAGFGGWLLQQIQAGAAQTAIVLIDRQRRTMGRLVGMALAQRQYELAQAMLQPLNEFWGMRGLGQEARGWVDRCRAALEDHTGAPPDLESAGGALWLFTVGNEAKRALLAGNLNAAQAQYEELRQRLQRTGRHELSS
jgi:hypothetical protein